MRSGVWEGWRQPLPSESAPERVSATEGSGQAGSQTPEHPNRLALAPMNGAIAAERLNEVQLPVVIH
jgi:hypothetical protein